MITGMLHLSAGNSGYEKFVQEAGIERMKGQGCPLNLRHAFDRNCHRVLVHEAEAQLSGKQKRLNVRGRSTSYSSLESFTRLVTIFTSSVD
jgi:hypothetical protein